MNIEQLEKAKALEKRNKDVMLRLNTLARDLEFVVGKTNPVRSKEWPEFNDLAETIATVVTGLLTQKKEQLEKKFAEEIEKI